MTLKMGKLIRYLRKQKKMTQSELGQGIISESALSRIENGMSEPGLFTLDKLFWKLGKTLQPFEIVISNKEFEALKRKKDTLMANTVVIAESEYFKDIREGKGLSQEKFSSDVCARETISNIEHGRTPRLRKVQDVLEKQGMVFERYHGYICASEFELYELAELYQQKKFSKIEEAKKLRLELKERLDAGNLVNLQFLESAELMEKRRMGKITVGEELAGLEKCLRYTMPEYDGELYRIPFRQEVIILEEIIACMKSLQRTAAAQQLAKEIEKKNAKKLKIS